MEFLDIAKVASQRRRERRRVCQGDAEFPAALSGANQPDREGIHGRPDRHPAEMATNSSRRMPTSFTGTPLFLRYRATAIR